MDNRQRLESMSREDLIAEIIERQNEAGDREVEFEGLQEAEKVSDAEADKYAALLKEADQLLVYWREWRPGAGPAIREQAGFATQEAFLEATNRHLDRMKAYAEGEARKTAKAVAAAAPKDAEPS